MPNLGGGESNGALIDLGRRVAQILFPGVSPMPPAMILRGAYAAFSYRVPPHHADPTIDAFFCQNPALTSQDAILFVGEVRR